MTSSSSSSSPSSMSRHHTTRPGGKTTACPQEKALVVFHTNFFVSYPSYLSLSLTKTFAQKVLIEKENSHPLSPSHFLCRKNKRRASFYSHARDVNKSKRCCLFFSVFLSKTRANKWERRAENEWKSFREWRVRVGLLAGILSNQATPLKINLTDVMLHNVIERYSAPFTDDLF